MTEQEIRNEISKKIDKLLEEVNDLSKKADKSGNHKLGAEYEDVYQELQVSQTILDNI